MPFLLPNQQRQSTEGTISSSDREKTNKTKQYTKHQNTIDTLDYQAVTHVQITKYNFLIHDLLFLPISTIESGVS